MGLSRPLFLYFCLFDTFDNRFTNALLNNSPMTGFEPRASGVGSDSSTNWATPLPTYNLPIQSDFFRTNPSLNCFGGIWWFQQFCVETMQGVNFESITNLHHSGLRTERPKLQRSLQAERLSTLFVTFLIFRSFQNPKWNKKWNAFRQLFASNIFFKKMVINFFSQNFFAPKSFFVFYNFVRRRSLISYSSSEVIKLYHSASRIRPFELHKSETWIIQTTTTSSSTTTFSSKNFWDWNKA